MTAKSDTPRMDAAWNQGSCADESLDPVYEEGCKLERDLAAAEAVIEKCEETLQAASEATAYSSHDDSCGYRVCCQVASYKPHAKDCYLSATLVSVRAWKESK